MLFLCTDTGYRHVVNSNLTCAQSSLEWSSVSWLTYNVAWVLALAARIHTLIFGISWSFSKITDLQGGSKTIAMTSCFRDTVVSCAYIVNLMPWEGSFHHAQIIWKPKSFKPPCNSVWPPQRKWPRWPLWTQILMQKFCTAWKAQPLHIYTHFYNKSTSTGKTQVCVSFVASLLACSCVQKKKKAIFWETL